MTRTDLLLRAALVVLTVTAVPALAGPRWDFDDGGNLQFGLLGQFHAVTVADAAADHDVYLRRGRLIFSGQIADGVKVFAETDNDNAGHSAASGVATDLQDLFVDLRLHGDHWLEVGLILLPLSFESTSSAASLLGLDYNAEVIKLANTFVWRDQGLMLHGASGGKFAYRAGVFDGYEVGTTKNPEAAPRFTGHLEYAVVGDAPTAWFHGQERLGGDPYLLLGTGIDYQRRANRAGYVSAADPGWTIDSRAFVLDLQSGFVVGGLFGTLNAGWYDWDNINFHGSTWFVESGLRRDRVQATGKFAVVDHDSGVQTSNVTAGLHYYRLKHKLRYGLEFSTGDSPNQLLAGVQFLL
ncbi:MAG: hypothetical protein Q7W56_11705 [Candidatus Latescibacteria bacterium]|nr:hypothetical protein [Candidatus Latescibacterota bacterium]